tara:strand:+ start:3296 stop:4258 length:963 start_codon:yes stop_codon:yes gene_type:complete
MKNKSIIIVPGEQESIFFEIFFKSLKSNRFRNPLILISSKKILKNQMKKNNFKKNIRLIKFDNLKKEILNNKMINLIDINKVNIQYKKQTKMQNDYLKKSFEIAFKILKSGFSYKFINGPVNKSNFLDKKYLGITEYISKNFKIKKFAMLIYNKDLSVCPVTTHLPLKLVAKNINKKKIIEKTKLINDFFVKNIGFKPKIAVTGLNPHCESILKFNEDKKIVLPAISFLKKKGYKIYGPLPADTVFLNQNRKKYNVIMGMYHDQVLTPIKSLKEYDAINITLGLPFLRVSPDHGPNKKMVNKNLSNPLSLIRAIKFLDNQ